MVAPARHQRIKETCNDKVLRVMTRSGGWVNVSPHAARTVHQLHFGSLEHQKIFASKK